MLYIYLSQKPFWMGPREMGSTLFENSYEIFERWDVWWSIILVVGFHFLHWVHRKEDSHEEKNISQKTELQLSKKEECSALHIFDLSTTLFILFDALYGHFGLEGRKLRHFYNDWQHYLLRVPISSRASQFLNPPQRLLSWRELAHLIWFDLVCLV